jgi:vesicle-associated membrane protein-associated protein B
MSLTISPEEIAFPATTGGMSTSHAVITLSNPTSSLVAFKVKTTAPNNYFVKPKSGTLSPGGSIEIQVTLQVPYANEQAGSTDRFLVQSAVCQTTEGLSRDEWARLDKFAISEKRLPVTFKSTATASVSGTTSSLAASGSQIGDGREAQLVNLPAEELVKYAVNLEKTKASQEQELAKLRNKPAALAKSSSGFSLFQLILALVVAVVVARVSALLGY